MNENYPDRKGCSVTVVFDVAEIVSLGKSTQHLGTDSFCGGNEKVSMSAEDLDEGSAVVKTGIQEKQIALFDAFDKLAYEFVLRGARFSVDES